MFENWHCPVLLTLTDPRVAAEKGIITDGVLSVTEFGTHCKTLEKQQFCNSYQVVVNFQFLDFRANLIIASLLDIKNKASILCVYVYLVPCGRLRQMSIDKPRPDQTRSDPIRLKIDR